MSYGGREETAEEAEGARDEYDAETREVDGAGDGWE